MGTVGRANLATNKCHAEKAHGQDFGATGDVLVRGFIGRVKVMFKAVVARQDDAS